MQNIESNWKEKRALERRHLKNKPWIWIVACVILLAGALILMLFNPEIQTFSPVRIGKPIFNLQLADLSGKTVQLKDFAGRPVLINTWATWCPPCRAEMPALNSFYQAHKAEGFVLLAINAGENSATVRDFIAQIGFSAPVLLDPGTKVINQLGIDSFPTSILIGRNGAVEAIHSGMFTEVSLKSEISPLLSH